MQRSAALSSLALPLLLAAAAVGYLSGLRHPPRALVAEPLSEARLTSAPGIVLERPRDWLRTAAGPAIEGLALQGALWLRPHSGAGRAGGASLLVGTQPLRAGSPLPAALLRRLRALPRTEVVDLDAGQAFRYRGELRRGGEALELYILPAHAGEATVLACRAAGPGSAAAKLLHECEGIAASAVPEGQPAGDLLPDPQYAARLDALVAALRPPPVRGASARRAHASFPSLARVAARRLSRAARMLSLLEPPPVAAPAQTELARALTGAAAAYVRLGAGAGGARRSSRGLAATQLASARAGLASALRTYALLGYRHAGPS